MAVHWFTIVCFVIAGIFFLFAVFFYGAERDEVDGWSGFISIIGLIAVVLGIVSAGQADNQNTGLASRNKQEFQARGYDIVHAYGHSVCVAAGTYKLCMQQSKDATGKKQLIMPKAHGGWVVVDRRFIEAVAQAPHQ